MSGSSSETQISIESAKAEIRAIVHDLNNALSTMNGAVRVLRKEIKGEKSAQALEKIEAAIKRGGDLGVQLNNVFIPKEKLEKTLEGNQYLFKVVGITVLLVGDDTYEEFFNQSGFEVLRAHNLDEALLIQDDYVGCIDLLVHSGGELHLLELFQSLRENTVAINIQGKGDIAQEIFNAVQQIVKESMGS